MDSVSLCSHFPLKARASGTERVELTHITCPRIQEKDSTLWDQNAIVRNVSDRGSGECKTEDRIVSTQPHQLMIERG